MKNIDQTQLLNITEPDMNQGKYYHDSFEHLQAELERIDQLVQLATTKAHKVFNSNDQFHGLYIVYLCFVVILFLY